MNYRFSISLLVFLAFAPFANSQSNLSIRFDFYGDVIELPAAYGQTVNYKDDLTVQSVEDFYTRMSATNYEPVINSLLAYKQQHKPDDWLFYQLIRKTAQAASPKADNYHRYTLYKWFLLNKTGYDAMLTIAGDQVLFYVQCDENIYDIPFRMKNGKQYICLNYHDYGKIDLEKTKFTEVPVYIPEGKVAFSYKLTQLPDFKPEDYQEKDLSFTYRDIAYQFKVKVNPQVKNIFANYPVADYQLYFNAPLSKETYSSLIPQLKKNLKGVTTKNGVDYLMRFTRYAFLYEPDGHHFGKEKRLSPEQTLLYASSDCEDRAALFFYLVKEIYNLPMIVLAYPSHVSVAVKFDKPIGKPIIYNGEQYSVCEPTPQPHDLLLGQLPKGLSNETYEVAFAYHPQ